MLQRAMISCIYMVDGVSEPYTGTGVHGAVCLMVKKSFAHRLLYWLQVCNTFVDSIFCVTKSSCFWYAVVPGICVGLVAAV